MCKLSGILLSLVIFSVFFAGAEQVKVSVYFESLCVYSQEFITKQLFPGYQIIGEYLEVDFIPYGKANKTRQDGEWLFRCQHGPEECIGNKYQVCGLDQNLTQDQNVGYINCMMAADNPAGEADAYKCSQHYQFDWSKIKICMNTFQGDDILAIYGDRTDAAVPKITFVPTIHFNDKYDEELQTGAQNDFLKVACSLLKEKPKECEGI